MIGSHTHKHTTTPDKTDCMKRRLVFVGVGVAVVVLLLIQFYLGLDPCDSVITDSIHDAPGVPDVPVVPVVPGVHSISSIHKPTKQVKPNRIKKSVVKPLSEMSLSVRIIIGVQALLILMAVVTIIILLTLRPHTYIPQPDEEPDEEFDMMVEADKTFLEEYGYSLLWTAVMAVSFYLLVSWLTTTHPYLFLVPEAVPEGVQVPRGLVNLGSTCFMNASLQCLAHLGVHERVVLDNRVGVYYDEVLMATLRAIKSGEREPYRPVEMHRAAIRFLNDEPLYKVNRVPQPDGSVREQRVLVQPLNPNTYNGTSQQDAHEFMIRLIGKSPDFERQFLVADRHIKFCHQQTHQLLDIYQHSETQETGVLLLQFPPPQPGPLSVRSLIDHFEVMERLEKSTEQPEACFECNVADIPFRHMAHRLTPRARHLIITVSRFARTGPLPTDSTLKIHTPVIPEPVLMFGSDGYELRAAVVHFGETATSGHYVACLVHCGLPRGKVLYVSDSHVGVVGSELMDSAYILFYTRV